MWGFGERSAVRRAFGLLAGVVAMAVVIGSLAIRFPQSAAAQSPTIAEVQPLDFVTATGTHHFLVEVMRTEAQREMGLMFRRYLPPNHGMLFEFKTVQPVMMWMKNTYLPLDMVFVSRTGIVTSIAQNTEPLSERIIPSGGPVYAVVEVNAGTAARIDLKPGDRVVQKVFE